MKLSIVETIAPTNIITHIKEGTEISGDVIFSDSLRVDTKVTGCIHSDSGSLVVGKQGSVQASVEAGFVQIFGTVEGTITAKHKVEIHTGGCVYGDIYTPALNIAPGALFDGKCHMIEAEPLNGNGTHDLKPGFKINQAAAWRPKQNGGHSIASARNGGSHIPANFELEKKLADLEKKCKEMSAKAEAERSLREEFERAAAGSFKSEANAGIRARDLETRLVEAESRAGDETKRAREAGLELERLKKEFGNEHGESELQAQRLLEAERELNAVKADLKETQSRYEEDIAKPRLQVTELERGAKLELIKYSALLGAVLTVLLSCTVYVLIR